MLLNTFSWVMQTLGTFFAAIVLLRFWINTMRVHPPMALGRFLFDLSDWVVLPFRKIFRGKHYDWASLFLAFLMAMLCILFELADRQIPIDVLTLLKSSALLILQWSFYGLMALLVVEAILSWVNPYAPIAPFIQALNEPWMRFLRRWVPPIGSVDLSPLIALIILRVIYQLLTALIILL